MRIRNILPHNPSALRAPPFTQGRLWIVRLSNYTNRPLNLQLSTFNFQLSIFNSEFSMKKTDAKTASVFF